MLALVLGVAGFYLGVRVEKGQIGTAGGSAFPLPTGAAGAGRSLGAFPGAGGLGATAQATSGTVTSVSRTAIYITSGSGDVIRVKLEPATTISKSLKVRRTSVRPGDSLVVQGSTASNGTVSATSVIDSGAGSPTSTTGASGSSSSGVSSLFGATGAG